MTGGPATGRGLLAAPRARITMRLLATVLTVCAATPAAADAEFGRWAPFVPPAGRATAEVMVLDAPADINAIAERVQQAAAASPEWFARHAEQAEPGKPLPWHANMGISEDEYRRLLSGAGERVLTRAGEVTIEFSADAGIVTLRGLPMVPPHDRLVYVPAENAVRTGFGLLTDFAVIDQDDPERPEGQWSGVRWSLPNEGGRLPVAVELSLGRLRESGLNMINLNVDVRRDSIPEQFHYLLLYPGS